MTEASPGLVPVQQQGLRLGLDHGGWWDRGHWPGRGNLPERAAAGPRARGDALPASQQYSWVELLKLQVDYRHFQTREVTFFGK